MARSYFSLIGKTADGKHEIVFGDYDKEVVQAEKEDADKDYYKSYKIIKTAPQQAAINAAVAALNA